MIFDLKNGFPKALLNARYMTAMRTGAAGAIGVRYLANPGAEILLMVGTGAQAIFQIAATISTVQSIKKVFLLNPMSFERAKEFQNCIKHELGKIREDINDPENVEWHKRIEAVKFISISDAAVFVDDITQAISVGETQSAVRVGVIQREALREIGKLIAGNVKGRISEQDITIFDSTGIALQDITVSKYLVEKAEELKLGYTAHI